ncbi:MAG: hypothetical protein HOP16_07275 [Acidobacteria bacterium]|nr:hypothetical protein [Acidobacteriota bacterium]
MRRYSFICVVSSLLASGALAPLHAQAPPAGVPDLSGAWRGQPLMSVSTVDSGGKMRGTEPDIPYQESARQKMLAEIPPTGPFGEPDKTTDPWIRYCEPNGPIRIYAHPGRTSFVQLPDRVLILHEVMQQFRIVRLNSKHPAIEDIDPSPWGDSIGWYENGALVVDSIGFNGRAWLDQQGKPTTERLHVTERFRRIDADTLGWDVVIDDPGAYTKPFELKRRFQRSNVPFMQSPWNCSVRDNLYFTETLLESAATPK